MPASVAHPVPPDPPGVSPTRTHDARAGSGSTGDGTGNVGDEAWIAALRAGDHDAVARLRGTIAARLGPALRRSGRGRSLAEADLEDLTQEASLRVLAKLDSFRGESRFSTWAMAIALRVGFTALRKRTGPGRFSGASLGDRDSHALEAVEAGGIDGAPPETEARRRELMDALRAAMARALTDRQRQVLLLDLAGTPRQEIADRLEVSSGSVHKMMHDARKKLRGALLAAGFDASDLVGHSLPAGGRP